ncbi:MAG TPA: hypothetical protein VF139_01225 [Candidatus Polarisedimenticolaceae bacterium]
MRAGRVALAALAASLVSACAPRSGAPSVRPDAPDAVGLYRAAATETGGRTSRFRLWVHAARPDRLHLEVLPPVGGTAFILDAGGDAVAASWVEDRVALTGPADAASMGRLIGIPIDARGWVSTILDGAGADGVTIERRGEPGSLPVSLTLRREGLEVRLERREVRRAAGEVGNGLPPAGFAVHPISAMEGPSLLDSLLASPPEGER